MWLKTIGTAVAVVGIAIGGNAYAVQETQQGRNDAYCLQKSGATGS